MGLLIAVPLYLGYSLRNRNSAENDSQPLSVLRACHARCELFDEEFDRRQRQLESSTACNIRRIAQKILFDGCRGGPKPIDPLAEYYSYRTQRQSTVAGAFDERSQGWDLNPRILDYKSSA